MGVTVRFPDLVLRPLPPSVAPAAPGAATDQELMLWLAVLVAGRVGLTVLAVPAQAVRDMPVEMDVNPPAVAVALEKPAAPMARDKAATEYRAS
jgi:hypothetical protein